MRIAEKFHMLINERNQSIRDIFVAFDDDGGGTIDPEELRDGFDALEVPLTDYEFERMWVVWDEDGGVKLVSNVTGVVVVCCGVFVVFVVFVVFEPGH